MLNKESKATQVLKKSISLMTITLNRNSKNMKIKT